VSDPEDLIFNAPKGGGETTSIDQRVASLRVTIRVRRPRAVGRGQFPAPNAVIGSTKLWNRSTVEA
jgi:hypothetical protein